MKLPCFFHRQGMSVLILALTLTFPTAVSYAGINEDLAVVDAVIKLSPTPIRIAGQDAYHIYQGADAVQLEKKRQLLNGIGLSSFAAAGKYSNFYSFTGTPGYTDTHIQVTTTTSPMRLYRRGSSAYPETQSYLGRWWGDKYRGIEATRNEQAVLAAWGSDLNRIYVMDAPAQTTLIGGIAAPMEKNGEYRGGGAYQYFYQGGKNNWLVYALYAPDYVKSYASAITGAQKVSQDVVNDLDLHMKRVRRTMPQAAVNGQNYMEREGEIWSTNYGAHGDYRESDGQNVNSHRDGMTIGWEKMLSGWKIADKTRSYIGIMGGQGNNKQKNTSNVENNVTATYGGIYGMYINTPESSRSWYGNYSLLYGNLDFKNKVPGEMGYGLNQDYTGRMMVFTLENGITFKRQDGLIIEPQLQFSYGRIQHNAFTDSVGANIALQKGDACLGRVGVEVRKAIIHSADQQAMYWAKVSYAYHFSNKNTVNVSGDFGESEIYRNHYLFTLGTDMKLSSRLAVQGEVGKVFGNEKGYQGNLSIKYKW